MSGLLFPSAGDFFISKGQTGDILCSKVNGICLMLFYSTQCIYCKKLIPIFKKLPETLNGAYFGMVNVFRTKDVCNQSKTTNTPITYVPLILLYVNNKPYMKYNGPHDINEIKRFVIEASQNIQNKKGFSKPSSTHTQPQSNRQLDPLPEYTIGKPICGEDGKCYLNFDTAYTDGEDDGGKVDTRSGPYKGFTDAYIEEKSPYSNQTQNQYGNIRPRNKRQ